MSYQKCIELAGAEILKFKYFGSYQGDWWAKVKYEGQIGWVHGSYGSCSGCDAFEAEFGWNDNEDDKEVKIRMVKFGEQYLDSIMDQEEAEKEASIHIEWDMDAKKMLKFIQDNKINLRKKEFIVEDNKTYTFTNGITIINTTPHAITFEDAGELISVQTSGIIINAKAVETIVKSGIPTLVKTNFIASEEDEIKLTQIETEFPGIIPIGSIIAAQAFPGRVFGMTPMAGFERVAPQEKRMNPDKFTTF